jgi:hypothetical protein
MSDLSVIETNVATFFSDAVAFIEHNGSASTSTAAATATTALTSAAAAVEALIEPVADDVLAYALSKVPGGSVVSPTATAFLNSVISKLEASLASKPA